MRPRRSTALAIRLALSSLVLVASLACMQATASAQSQSTATVEEDKARARELATMGFAAMDTQNWAKAEDAFRRADAIYHAPTLTVALARAQAHLGKVVEAWESYHRVVAEGAPPGANDSMLEAVENAKKEIGAVEQRRCRVTIQVSGSEHATITLDGAALDASKLGTVVLINPGAHTLHAAADGCAPLDTPFTIAEGGAATVPMQLVPLSPSPSPGAPASSTSGGSGLMTGAFVAFGLGGAGLITGAVVGALAAGKHGDLKNNACSSGPCADPTSFNSELGSYHTMTTVSTVAFVVGGVGAAAGGLLFFLAPRSSEQQHAGVRVFPYAGIGSGGVTGRF